MDYTKWFSDCPLYILGAWEGSSQGVGVQKWLETNDPGMISRSNKLGFSDFYHPPNREGLMMKSKITLLFYASN